MKTQITADNEGFVGVRMRAIAVALFVTGLLIAVALLYADDPVARFVQTLPWFPYLHLSAAGSPVLLTLGCVVVLGAFLRVTLGHPLRKLGQVLVLASFSLGWAVCAVEFLLKPLFGRTTPTAFLHRGIDTFRWFHGSPLSSFPSGHAVQIVSFGSVFLMNYPTHRVFWLGLMSTGLVILVLGNWHFVSDVIAGAAFGGVAGLATVGLWRAGPG